MVSLQLHKNSAISSRVQRQTFSGLQEESVNMNETLNTAQDMVDSSMVFGAEVLN